MQRLENNFFMRQLEYVRPLPKYTSRPTLLVRLESENLPKPGVELFAVRRCDLCYHTECGCSCSTCVVRRAAVEALRRGAVTLDPTIVEVEPLCRCHRCSRVRRRHKLQRDAHEPLSPLPGSCAGCGAPLGHDAGGTQYSAVLEPGTVWSAVTAVACDEGCREAALDAAAARLGARVAH